MKAIDALFMVVFFMSCSQKMHWQQPAHFPDTVYDVRHREFSRQAVELGRALFYDPILSADGTTSCASCHSSYNAFAHTDHDLSHGIGDQIGTRNAPALFNLAWYSSFMWDGAIQHLDAQALAPITHPKEMGSDLEHVILKLNQSDVYPKLFSQVFHEQEINTAQLLKALSMFQLTLVSGQARYDSVKLQKAQFTEQEQKGYHIFLEKCNSCHTEPLFTNHRFENNGLPSDTTLCDAGRYVITRLPGDSLKFKVPTLRNLTYTYPYMHDGRFKTLSQVLNHYSKGIRKTPTLSPELQNGIPLTANEKADLIAFLLTLNDAAFVRNESFAFPQDHPALKNKAYP